MNQVIVLSVCIIASFAAGYPSPSPAYDKSYSYPPVTYTYSYVVKDEPSYNDFGHNEKSDGDVVNGSYFVVLPDGRRQVVDYKADYNGYTADVKYEGETKAYENKATYKANPVYPYSAYKAYPTYPTNPQYSYPSYAANPRPAYAAAEEPTRELPVEANAEVAGVPAHDAKNVISFVESKVEIVAENAHVHTATEANSETEIVKVVEVPFEDTKFEIPVGKIESEIPANEVNTSTPATEGVKAVLSAETLAIEGFNNVTPAVESEMASAIEEVNNVTPAVEDVRADLSAEAPGIEEVNSVTPAVEDVKADLEVPVVEEINNVTPAVEEVKGDLSAEAPAVEVEAAAEAEVVAAAEFAFNRFGRPGRY